MNYNIFLKTPTYQVVYSWWLWIWGLFFYFNIIPYSPLPSLILALMFTSYTQIVLFNSTILMKFVIIFIEFLIVFLIFTKKKIVNKKDIIANLILFAIYNIYLFILKKTNIYEVYFKHLKKKITTKQENYLSKLFLYNRYYFLFIGLFLIFQLIRHKLP